MNPHPTRRSDFNALRPSGRTTWPRPVRRLVGLFGLLLSLGCIGGAEETVVVTEKVGNHSASVVHRRYRSMDVFGVGLDMELHDSWLGRPAPLLVRCTCRCRIAPSTVPMTFFSKVSSRLVIRIDKSLQSDCKAEALPSDLTVAIEYVDWTLPVDRQPLD